MSDVLVSGAFSEQLGSGIAQMATPMAAMSGIEVDGAASVSTNSVTNALRSLL